MQIMFISLLVKGLVLISSLILMTLILKQSTRRPINRAMALYLCTLVFWQVCSLMVSISSFLDLPQQAIYWYRLQVAGSTGYFIMFFALVTTFRNAADRYRLRTVGHYLILFFAAASLLFGQVFMSEVSKHSSGLLVPAFGPLIFLPGLVSFTFLGFSFYDLCRDYQSSRHTIARNRLSFLLLCAFLVLVGALSNLNPLLQGYPVDSLFILLHAMLLSYAIFRHQLLEIQVIFRVGLVHSLLVVFISALVLLAVTVIKMGMFNLTGYGVILTSMLVLVFTFSSFRTLREELQKYIDRIFLPEKTRLYSALEEMTEDGGSITSLESTLDKIYLLCKKTFQVSSIYLLVKNISGDDYCLWETQQQENSVENFSVNPDSPLVHWFEKKASPQLFSELLVMPEFKGMWQSEIAQFMNKQIEAVFPLSVKGEIIGMLCTGPRLNGRPFTRHYLQTVQIFVQQAAVLIKNSFLYEQTRLLSITDPLTGTYNRRMLKDSFIYERKKGNNSIGLILMDIYNFKYFNERYGHQAGDKVLQDVAALLKESIRSKDLVIRYGGDEFAIFLPEADLKEAGLVAERIQNNLAKWNKNHFFVVDEELILKQGIYSAQTDNLDEIISEADKRLFEDQKNVDRKQLLNIIENNIRDKKSFSNQTVLALAKAVEVRDPFSRGHSERVKDYSLKIGKEMGLYGPQLDKLSHAAFLHDIGKIGIPAEILRKKDPLTEEEIRLIKLHPVLSAEILREVEMFKDIADLVLYHHERYDGRVSSSPMGYPHGLKGEEIPLLSRIIAVADAFDAMTSYRPYRQPLSLSSVESIMKQESGKQFDAQVVASLLSLIKRKDINIPQ